MLNPNPLPPTHTHTSFKTQFNPTKTLNCKLDFSAAYLYT